MRSKGKGRVSLALPKCFETSSFIQQKVRLHVEDVCSKTGKDDRTKRFGLEEAGEKLHSFHNHS